MNGIVIRYCGFCIPPRSIPVFHVYYLRICIMEGIIGFRIPPVLIGAP